MNKIIFEQNILEKIVEHYNQYHNLEKIIRDLNLKCSTEVIKRYLKEIGIYIFRPQRNPNKKEVKSFEDDILKPWLAGTSLYKLNQEYQMSKATMSKKLKELGYTVENTHKSVKFDDTIFDLIDTEKKAYWLGFIFADGNINKHKSSKESYTLTIALKSADYKHLEKFCNFLSCSNDNIKIINRKLNEKQYKQCRLEVHSRHLWETLNSIGVIPCKSLIIQFPPESIFKNKSLIKHFIRGYFDGDGCLSFYKRAYDIIPHCSFVGTESFIKNSKLYIPYESTFRVRDYSKTKENCHDLYELVFDRKNSELFLDWLYKDTTIYLDRKYERYRLFKKYNFEIPYTESKLKEVFGILS